MRPEQRFLDLCADIVEWGERIPIILGGKSFDAFVADQACHLAIWKCVEVLGEASSNILKLDAGYADRYAGLPLRQAYAMRNQLTHGYGAVDLAILWTTATRFVPPMVDEAKAILAAHG